jgi:hypothetical protein
MPSAASIVCQESAGTGAIEGAQAVHEAVVAAKEICEFKTSTTPLPLVSGTAFVRSTHIVDCSGSRLVLPRPEAK